jgi:hypothetical protein
MNKSHYTVIYQGFRFGATILQPEKILPRERQQYIITFGGRRKCVDITLYNGNETAWITGLTFKPKCMLGEEPLKRGNDGTVVMLKSALSFCAKKYSFVKRFRFLDNSHIDCDKDKSKRISLSSFYIAKHGITWYMAKFQAYPVKKKHLKQLERGNEKLDKIKSMSFENFVAHYIQLHGDRIDGNELKKELTEYYEGTKTFREFVMKVNEAHKDCTIFYFWLDYFIRNLFDIPLDTMEWFIDSSPYIDYEIEVVERENTSFVKKRTTFDFLRNTMQGGNLFFPYGRGATDIRNI